ncbi:uncharacterized protein LOC113498993 [Trichoplusia ni]|uniref:Uncharacterized protein LOC113498993 n=1 Tax=Trichoplusia ni TaxID=7111 RepID=A0A7E5W394_TRINI|nr:uncharacterized protein LOC113498993 [Trichoplusia ni]
MWGSAVFFVFVCFLQYVAGFSQLCGNRSEVSCTTEILGQNHVDYDMCKMKVYQPDSPECGAMTFGPLSPNTHIGGVVLKPYIMTMLHYDNINPFAMNHTVLNITFNNIKWKTMKFRFQDKYRDMKNHCRNIMISNDVTIDDQSVLYYDCYWPKTDDKDGQSHILDFEATTDDGSVNRGQYYFNIPSAEMLSLTTTEERWKPFIYIEIFPGVMRLHIMPPPRQLKITAYHIKVVTTTKETVREVKATTIRLMNNTDEVTYDFNFVGSNGSFSFVVKPLHDKCVTKDYVCQVVESPRIMISSEPQTLNICIASVTALVVATLFAYYIALRLIRRYWCNDRYKLAMGIEIPIPPKILVAYSPTNRLHAECVSSFVAYLRSEYGFEVMFDGDISLTSHGDPYIWAEEAFRLASHVLYIVGPPVETNLYNNIYDKPIISPLKDVDTLLLSFIKATRAQKSSKEIINIRFNHSSMQTPIETSFAPKFKLIEEWNSLISFLSKNLFPKRQIMRTEKGRCFLDDLARADELLGGKKDDLYVQCERNKNFEKKILL